MAQERKKYQDCGHIHPSLRWVTDQLPEVQMAKRLSPKGMLYLRSGDYLQSWAILANIWFVLHKLEQRIGNEPDFKRWTRGDSFYYIEDCVKAVAGKRDLWAALTATRNILEHRYMRSKDKRLQTAARAALIAQNTAWQRSWDIFRRTDDLKAANVPWTEAVADLAELSGAPVLGAKLVELFKRSDRPELRPGEVPCDKCGGLGVLPQYIHVDGGVCYDCGGSGKEEDTYRGRRE